MITPTIQQRCDAQKYATALSHMARYPRYTLLLTADELRAALAELEQLRNRVSELSNIHAIAKLERERDQWREIAKELNQRIGMYMVAYHDPTKPFKDVHTSMLETLARFDALVAKELSK